MFDYFFLYPVSRFYLPFLERWLFMDKILFYRSVKPKPTNQINNYSLVGQVLSQHFCVSLARRSNDIEPKQAGQSMVCTPINQCRSNVYILLWVLRLRVTPMIRFLELCKKLKFNATGKIALNTDLYQYKQS